jgi:hypothetical protein
MWMRILLLPAALCGTGGGVQASEEDTLEVEVSPQTMLAVEQGLKYLVSHQEADGAWLGHVGYKLNQDYRVLSEQAPHVGVTALAGMAFLAGGHLPDRGMYGPTLSRAITFLLTQVNDLGFITANHTRMYSHAFATLFLAEVYGMTPRSDVRSKLQQAVDLVVASQNKAGSWRYEPFALESDMSITVCQLMALRAARNIGIKVPAATIDRAVEYVLKSQVRRDPRPFSTAPSGYYRSGPGAFKYQDTTDARSSFALTAAGVTSLYHAARYNEATLRDSLDFLESTQRLVSADHWRQHYFYFYGHYYAVQAMFITGGERWRSYYRKVSSELLADQLSDGSWRNTVGPGANFSTAVASIVLQTPYRYLPILQR